MTSLPRTSKDSKEAKKLVTFEVDAKLYALIRHYAIEHGVTISALLRKYLQSLV